MVYYVYVYRLFDEQTSMSYIGSRAKRYLKSIEVDKGYKGSSTIKGWKEMSKRMVKTVIDVLEHDGSDEGYNDAVTWAKTTEAALHDLYDVASSPHYYNLAKQTAFGYNCRRVHSEAWKKAVIKSNSGPRPAALGMKHTDETKKLMSEQKMGKLNPMFGRTTSDATKAKLSVTSAGARNGAAKPIDVFDFETGELLVANTTVSNYISSVGSSNKKHLRDTCLGKREHWNGVYGRYISGSK